MFVDVAKIQVKAGRGGDGAVAFHREKYVAAGGPDGGDGGRGGNIIFIMDGHMSSLMDFRYKRKYAADDGEKGLGSRCFGRDASDIIIKVPRGTLIRDAETGKLLHDMSDNEPFIAAKGGRGGWGNSHFATPTRQAPQFAKPGLHGEEKTLILELKLLADVGIVGFPNVGKSTLLSVISAARPKIADYPFTTLSPNLGVVTIDESTSFVVADIPGIIEGAIEGAGLGFGFLRHIERCRLLIHIVDVSGWEGRKPIEDFEAINRELNGYSAMLAGRPQIVAANKMDILQDVSILEEFREYLEKKGIPLYEMSTATRMGVDKLVKAAAEELQKLPPVLIFEADPVQLETSAAGSHEMSITAQDNVYTVEGKWLERAMESVNFSDYESRMYFERILKNAGVFSRLEEMGIQEGDTVSIYNLSFEYIK